MVAYTASLSFSDRPIFPENKSKSIQLFDNKEF
jgi:hypothetical protein